MIKTFSDAAEQKKIGMLTPSSNTTLEPICSKMVSGLEDKVTMHYGRFKVTKISLEDDALNQFDFEPMLDADRMLADADVDVIAWNGTSGGWLGFDMDRQLCERIEDATGIPATTSMLSQVKAFQDFNVQKIHMITPYLQPINELIRKEYAKCGVEVINDVCLNQSVNRSFSRVPQEKIRSMFEEVCTEPADGISVGTSSPDNNKGALIYGEYEVEELRCDGNKGMNLLKFNVSIYKDAVTVPLGTLTDDKIEISTTAKDEKSGSQLSKPDEKVTLVDTVEYEGLKKGQEYKVIGTLMDKETGKEVEVDDKTVTAETTFTAKKSSGSVDVTFEFDGSSLKGKTVVVFEELYHEDLQLAVHADIEDTDQTIYFPEIGTTAKDAESGTSVAKADEKVTLVDTVAYKNLIAGKEYKVIGTLMDKETEKAVEVDGKAITAEATFKPESTEGTTDVTFEFDGSVLAGKTVVVFESVSYKEKEIAVHADIDDEGQTIFFPEIGTTATDQEDGDHEALADTEVTITDTVEYKNLTPGTEYKVVGVLMDKETGKEVLINEKNVVSEATFKAEKESGTVDVTFTFDGSTLAGHDVVVYEKLFAVTAETEIEVAAHEDITDEGQTVKLVEEPKPETPKETIETPKTGDESNVGAWIATAVICLGALAAYGAHMLRKKKKDDEE